MTVLIAELPGRRRIGYDDTIDTATFSDGNLEAAPESFERNLVSDCDVSLETNS